MPSQRDVVSSEAGPPEAVHAPYLAGVKTADLDPKRWTPRVLLAHAAIGAGVSR